MAETIIIDALTREITVPESERAFGVAGEHDVTRKHFRVNGRIVDGNDLAVGFAWKVCTENSAKRPNEYPIDSIIADSEGIEFDWLVGKGALAYKGSLKFAVCAKQVDDGGKIQHEWHSKIGMGDVSAGIEASAEDIGGFDLRAYIQQTAAEVRQAVQDAANSAAASSSSANAAKQSAQDADNRATDAENAANRISDSMTQIAANTVAVSQLKEELETVKQQAANITPDDSTVGKKPWSSKNIVDMLCPPLEESGNPVVCYPVAGYPLGVKASWEPVQEGSGTPSQENIRPIKGRDSVTVERCGENILNPKAYASVTTNGITFTVNDDKSVRIAGTATGRAVFKLYSYNYKMSLPDGKYTFSTIANIPSGVGVLIGCYYKSELPAVYKKNLITLGSGKSSSTVSLSGVEWLDGYIDVSSGSTVDTTLYPILVLGTTAPTTYKPYNGSTNTLTLPETVYGGEVDAVTGEGQETWKTITLDGTEGWHYDTRGFFIGYLPQKAKYSVVLCDRYTGKAVSTAEGLYTENGILVIGTSVCGYTTISGWKDYLAAQYAAGTPVQICYKLAEPVSFTVTGAQSIPALAGVNTVLTDADSATVTGRADPIKRITDLEDAVASQT